MSDLTSPVTCRCGENASRASDDARLSRRALLGGALAGTIAAAARPVAAQIDGTPPAPPELSPPGGGGETVVDRAFALDNDPETIFRFVAEEIRYEPYDGALRGAQGALWARAANSVDRAALLFELLKVAQVPCRLAFGSLVEEGESRLAAAATPPAEDARAGYDAALRASLPPASGADATLAALTGDQQEIVGLAIDQAAALRDHADALTGAAVPIIAEALAVAGIAFPEVRPPLTDLERSRHAWVQTADGPDWSDLDPCDANAIPGEAIATLEMTADAVPDDMYHRVRITLAAEEVMGGVPTRRDVLSWEAAGTRCLNVPVALAMTGRDDLGDVGVSITDLFQGTVSLVPCLVAGDDVVTATTPLVFGSDGGGVTGVLDEPGGTGPAEGESLAVWLVAEVIHPTEGSKRIERTLLDRVGFAARAAGTVDLDAIAPVTFVTDAAGVTTVADLAGLSVITIDLARMPSLYPARDARSAELLGDLHLFGAAQASLRTVLGFAHESPAGYWSYPDGPNLTALTVRLVDPASSDAGVEVGADLLLRKRALLPLAEAGATNEVPPQVLAGVLEQVAEQVLINTLATTGEGAPAVVAPTVGAVFAEAARAEIPVMVVSTPDELAQLKHGEDALARMRGALDQGQVVVVPAAPVTVGGEPVSGWWLVDPVTGWVRDEMDNGRGSAGGVFALQPGTGYGRLLSHLRVWAAPYIALGRCLALVGASAVRAADYSGSGDVAGAVVDTLKSVDVNELRACA